VANSLFLSIFNLALKFACSPARFALSFSSKDIGMITFFNVSNIKNTNTIKVNKKNSYSGIKIVFIIKIDFLRNETFVGYDFFL
ncbi:hypothetical protein, partial [Campylobacter lari]|uniref:hypothetical protein n=1 Tax=Campylobacter lari TaxID=201 RepID=UPI001C499C7C